MRNALLFLTPCLVWGSTWIVIKFQLGVVDPLYSVSYRFFLAGIILLIYCKIKKLNLKYTLNEHLFLLLQGILIFGLNYWLVYLAELQLTSGLVAIAYSTIIFFNVLNGRIFLKLPVRTRVILGGIVGFIGVMLIFKEEFSTFDISNQASIALFLAVISVMIASLGDITSARNQRNNLPVLQSNVFCMLYGSLVMFLISLVIGKRINFDFSPSYISSLFYLVVFGSIIGFGCYLTMVGRIGADKAAYVGLIIPIIALVISTVFEGYQWTYWALAGVILAVSGNFIALKKSKIKG